MWPVQEGNGDDSNWNNTYASEEQKSTASSPINFSAGEGFLQREDQNEDYKRDEKQGLGNQNGSKVLPFEFVALEACLEAACSCLDNEVLDLLPLTVKLLA